MKFSGTWSVRALLLGSSIAAGLNAYLAQFSFVSISTSTLIASAVLSLLVCIHFILLKSPWWVFYFGMWSHHAACVVISLNYPGFLSPTQQITAGVVFIIQYLLIWAAEKVF